MNAFRLVMIAVRKVHEPEKMPTNKDVANYLDPKLTGQWADTWTIEGVISPKLDVDTLASLVEDANLTGEQTVELLGRITGDSIKRGLERLAKEVSGAAQ